MIFSTVEYLANQKNMYVVCKYRYELYNSEHKMIFWSYFLSDMYTFLENYNA